MRESSGQSHGDEALSVRSSYGLLASLLVTPPHLRIATHLSPGHMRNFRWLWPLKLPTRNGYILRAYKHRNWHLRLRSTAFGTGWTIALGKHSGNNKSKKSEMIQEGRKIAILLINNQL